MPPSNEPGRPSISAAMSDQIAAVLLVMPVDVLDAICRLRNPAACLAPAPVEPPASVVVPERGASGEQSTLEPGTWLSVKQFVAHSGGSMSYSLVTKLAREGQIPAVRLGRKWLIRADAIDTVAAEKRQSRERPALVDQSVREDTRGTAQAERPRRWDRQSVAQGSQHRSGHDGASCIRGDHHTAI